MGFWDQRTALERVRDNISSFFRNLDNITVGGYSAGALSAFQQLAHKLYHVSEDDAIIKRMLMFSNSPSVQAKTLQQHQKKFDEYITQLGIPLDVDDDKKLERLRAIPFGKLITIQSEMDISEFRALSDGVFYPINLMNNIISGDFAKGMRSRNITLINGECREEHHMYRNWRTPENAYSSLYSRLCGEYPENVSRALLQHYRGPSQSLPSGCADWQELFGRIYADV